MIALFNLFSTQSFSETKKTKGKGKESSWMDDEVQVEDEASNGDVAGHDWSMREGC